MASKQLIFQNAVRDLTTGQFFSVILIDGGGSYTMYIRDNSQPPTQPANVAQITIGGATPVVDPSGGGIIIGVTAITGGVDTRSLFDSAGVVGERPVTGTGNDVLSASPTLTGTVGLAALTATGTIVQTSANAAAFESGPNGSTNPVLRIVNNVASAATGLSVTGNAAGSGVTLTALSSGSNEDIRIVPKGTGTIKTSSDIRLADQTLLRWDESNIYGFQKNNASDGSYLRVFANNNEVAGFATEGVRLAVSILSWGTSLSTAGRDTGLARNAAGIVEINNGTAGTLRDLKLRGLTQAAGGLLSISSGTDQRAGNATLSGGTVTVSNTTVTASTIVILTRKTSGGTIGTAITYTVSAGVSFTITSDNVLDTSVFSYVLIEVS